MGRKFSSEWDDLNRLRFFS